MESNQVKTIEDAIAYGAKRVDIENLSSVPNSGGVYFLCDGEDVVYIGNSEGMRARIKTHIGVKKFNGVLYLCFMDRQRMVYEKLFINIFRPVLNKKLPEVPNCVSRYAQRINIPLSMIKYRLNLERINEEVAKLQLNYTEFARLLGWSRSLFSYALYHGGKSFAPKIAKVLGLDASEIIVVQPNKKGPAGAGNPARRG